MDVACINKLAEDNRGTKNSLVRRDVFDRTIDVRGMETKDPQGALRDFAQMITKKKETTKALC